MAATSSKHAGEGETTYLDTELRVKRAEELLCDQHTSGQIVRKLVEEFGIVERTAYTTLKIAYDRLSKDAAADRGIRKARARATWQRHYQRCIKNGNDQAAGYALDRLCRLDGLFAPEKIEHTTTTITVDVQMNAVINVLDVAGLAALDIVLAQLDAARSRGQLLEAPDPEDDNGRALPDGEEGTKLLARDGKPVPIPANGRGRKPKPKAKA